MAALVVDTSVWIEFFRGRSFAALESALAESRVVMPSLVVSELLSGRFSEPQRLRLVDFLRELPLHETFFPHWAAVGRLRARLAAEGLSVTVPDAHVAQCALELNGRLLTLDRVFERIAQRIHLKLLQPAD